MISLMSVMRRLFFVFLICFLAKVVFSQKGYYVYIQTENQQPFYVRTDTKMLNSSGDGYLIIPNLENNTYELIIGFPGKKEPEWQFSCTVKETDMGFVLSDNSPRGVELLNLKRKEGLSGTIVKQLPVKAADTVIQPSLGIMSNDPFSAMLADVVNDPTIRQQLVIIKKPEVIAVASVTNDAVVKEAIASVPSIPVDTKKESDKKISSLPPETTTKASIKTDAPQKESTVEKEIEKPDLLRTDIHSKAAKEKQAADDGMVAEVKKEEQAVVKEIEKTDHSTATISLKPVEGKKADSIKTSEEDKRYKPFVVKEIRHGDNVKTADSSVMGLDKKADKVEETKYLPFVVKPLDQEADVKADKNLNRKEKKAKDIVANNDGKKQEPFEVKEIDVAKNTIKEKASTSKADKKDKEPVSLKEGEVAGTTVVKRVLSSVKKTMERRSRDGVELIYVDEKPDGTKDTIRILIPASKP